MLTYYIYNFLVQYIPLYQAPEVMHLLNQAISMTLSNLCNPCIFAPIYAHHKCFLPRILLFWSQFTDTCRQKLCQKEMFLKLQKNSKSLEFNVMNNKGQLQKC